jgi:hypothetical protein
MSIKLYTANRGSIKQHQEDTKYLQWQDGMYVMLKDLLCDYEKALVENSLRDSVYFKRESYFKKAGEKILKGALYSEDCLGVGLFGAGLWWSLELDTKITRAQALYIATGDTTCIGY